MSTVQEDGWAPGRGGLVRKIRPNGIRSQERPARSKSLHEVRHTGLLWQAIITIIIKVKWSRYRPGVAQRVGRGIALLFHDRGTRRGWVVSSTPRPHFTAGKDPVHIVLEAGWAPGPVWTGGNSRPHRDSIPDSPARSQSLYRLSYPAHNNNNNNNNVKSNQMYFS